MKTVIFLLLAVTTSVQAEIFKCKSATGKIQYQPTPCPPAAQQQVIEIKKEDPRRLEEAQSRFKTWQAEQEVLKEKELKKAKERQEELDRQEAINALKRSAIAEEKAAAAAAAAAQQPVIINRLFTPLHRFPPDSFERHIEPHTHDQHDSDDMRKKHDDVDAKRRSNLHDRSKLRR